MQLAAFMRNGSDVFGWDNPYFDCSSTSCAKDILVPTPCDSLSQDNPYSLQLCLLKRVVVGGTLSAAIMHVQLLEERLVLVRASGVVSAEGQGCGVEQGPGHGQHQHHDHHEQSAALPLLECGGSGGGYGGDGGMGTCLTQHYNLSGGGTYGLASDACLPGSGGGRAQEQKDAHVDEGVGEEDVDGGGSPVVDMREGAGGGVIVLGSPEWPVQLVVNGLVSSSGRGWSSNSKGPGLDGGAGSGGSILLYLTHRSIAVEGMLLDNGRDGACEGGGGGGGRNHFSREVK